MTPLFPSSIVEAAREELAELLAELEAAVLSLEKHPEERAWVDRVFRALHTIKGTAQMLGLDEAAALVHELESVHDAVRAGKMEVSRKLIDITLAVQGRLRLVGDGPVELADLLAAVQSLSKQLPQPGPSQVAPEAPGAIETFRIVFRPQRDILASGLDPLVLLGELHALGECDVRALTDNLPPIEGLDPEDCHTGWEITLRTNAGENAVRDVFIFVEGRAELWIEKTNAAKPLADNAPHFSPGPASGVKRARASLRVDSEKLDGLVELVGQLVTSQARLMRLSSMRDDQELQSISEEIERLTWYLRDSAFGMRVVPIGTIFARLQRLVRDLAADTGKQISLSLNGEETELDKTIIEKIVDPLIHLIRNAIDHGIEAPERRRAKGKPGHGTIDISALHAGHEVIIRIEDDGAGLDRQAIQEKAIELGLAPSTGQLPTAEALVFAAGLSTACKVSALSGRGVGLDAVKQVVEELRGTVVVESTVGRGTVFTIRLPLTLAIIGGLRVTVGSRQFIIPLSEVEECLELSTADQGWLNGKALLDVRGQLVPSVSLRERAGVAGAPAAIQQVVVTVVDGMRVGIVVDQVLGEHQTVVKSLSKIYRGVKSISGATILGDGSIALIVDVAGLLRAQERAEIIVD